MKALASICLLLFSCTLSISSYASHIASGEFFYYDIGSTTNGDRQYLIRLQMSRDALNSLIIHPKRPIIGIYHNNEKSELIQAVTLKFIREYQDFSSFACLNDSSSSILKNYRTYVAVYEQIITVPPSTLGYILSYDVCCRTFGSNLKEQETESQGVQLTSLIPPTHINNSSSATLYQNFLISKVNDTASIQFPRRDEEGDSLVIYSIPPQVGFATGFRSSPEPPATYNPAQPAIYKTNYNILQPFGPESYSYLNLANNTYYWYGSQPSRNFHAFRIDEYRNGIKIASKNIELTVDILNVKHTFSQSNNPRKLEGRYLRFPKQIALKWVNCLGDVKTYEVYRSTNGGSFNRVGTTQDVIYEDKNVNAGNIYGYFIKGIPLSTIPSGVSDTLFVEMEPIAGIKHFRPQNNLVISPNPTSGKISISSDKPIDEIAMISATGELLLNLKPITPGPIPLSLNEYSDGIYFLRISSQRNEFYHKVIVQHH